jgi:hypothetical protein
MSEADDDNAEFTDDELTETDEVQMDAADATLTVEFPLDDFHEMLVTEIDGQADIDVSQIVAANHVADVEQTIHQLYQRGKYSQ